MTRGIKDEAMCWRCRHDHQSCVRDPPNFYRCQRCEQFGYTCAIERPEQVPEGRSLNFMKCDQCRKDRQKCAPKGSDWPERCDRCVLKGFPCSVRSQTKGQPRSRRTGSGGEGSSRGGGPTDSQGGEGYYDNEEEYEEEDDGSGYGSGSSGGYQQHAAYGQTGYGQGYSNQQYGYGGYTHDAYGQPVGYGQAQYGYTY
ncbi:hypothetical protein ABW19_dt0210319 [Dactylella cylindrospora]|nr:hypothetical protein ABW19_dt0210319 [Dactylella cylindrospora]